LKWINRHIFTSDNAAGRVGLRSRDVKMTRRQKDQGKSKKGLPFGNPFFYMAEAQRFELWNPFGSPVFKTGAFNRSATLPV
jgi:hypothetical protein